MDLDSVINDVATNILEPFSESPEINNLYIKGSNLRKDMGNELVPRLKNLKDEKVYEVVVYIEHLNNQLNR